MGARDLLAELSDAGLRVSADGEHLVIRPASKLTDIMRVALRAAKPELLVLLKSPQRPYALTPAEADRCHSQAWDDAACARFAARVTLFLRQGTSATDADDLAERLHLRDLDGDDRACCLECASYRPVRCGNHQAAGLQSPIVGRDLSVMLQRCPAFKACP